MNDATNEREQVKRCPTHWPEKMRLDGSCRVCEPRWSCPNCQMALTDAGNGDLQCVPCERLWPRSFADANFKPR